MRSTPLAYPQVIPRTFASFRVPKSGICPVQSNFGAGSIPGSSTEKVLVKRTKFTTTWCRVMVLYAVSTRQPRQAGLAPSWPLGDEAREIAGNRRGRTHDDAVFDAGCKCAQSNVSRDRQTDSVKKVTGLQVVHEEAGVIRGEAG
jgi:hypothetical protein